MIDRTGLAAKISPQLISALMDREEEILAAIDGAIKREAMKLVWPHILDLVPTVATDAVAFISDEFGTLSVNDLLEFLAKKV